MLTEHVENLVDTAPLLASGIELAIAVGSRTAFAEAIIAFRVYLLGMRDERHVPFAVMHILTTFQYYRTQAKAQ